MSDIPNRLKKLRTDKGLTQKQLADSLNVSQNAVYNWENGKREPNLDTMKKIAKVFDIALYILLDDSFPLPDITSESWENRARFLGDTEMTTVPRFTTPLHTNDDIHNEKNLDDLKFNGIMHKTDRGEELTPQESIFKSAYLERALRSIGDSFAQYYAMLNEEGQKKADEEITRTIKQLELLTKIPEYRKKD